MDEIQESGKSGKFGKRAKKDVSGDTGSPGGKSAGKKDFEIDIFRGWCKSCGICAAFCPRGCIRVNEEGAPEIADSSRCTGCGWCELHCPDFAVSVREKTSQGISPEE